jgi:hypothetical protein
MTLLTLYSSLAVGALATVAMACSSSSSGAPANTGGDAGSEALPTISITSPATGSTVMVVTQTGSGEIDIPVAFGVTDFALMPAGTCPGPSPDNNNCGHVHLYVDPSVDGGASPCTPPGDPYNNASPLTAGQAASPMNAIMSECVSTDAVNGPHTLLLELHQDNHAPVVGADGKTISSTLSFTAAGD